MKETEMLTRAFVQLPAAVVVSRSSRDLCRKSFTVVFHLSYACYGAVEYSQSVHVTAFIRPVWWFGLTNA